MPMHDWTRVRSGTYHFFHQNWIISLATALNTGGLPTSYFALAEQRTEGPEPDILALELPPSDHSTNGEPVGLAVALAPPRTRFRIESDKANYARRADRLAVRHYEGNVVAIIEILSPGNKDGQGAIDAFVGKIAAFLRVGIHVLIVDPFPPTRRDPQGIHDAIWDQIEDQPFELPSDKPLTLASYEANGGATAYVEPVAVGDVLADMPLFLKTGRVRALPA